MRNDGMQISGSPKPSPLDELKKGKEVITDFATNAAAFAAHALPGLISGGNAGINVDSFSSSQSSSFRE